MQFIDLPTQQKKIRSKIEDNIRAVLDHGQYIMGPEIGALETRLADYVGAGHAIGCASGTDALLLALMAYDVGPGDAIITTPFTFIATAEVISLLGATPVFADIDPKTYNIDPIRLEKTIMALISEGSPDIPIPQPLIMNAPKPKGIIAVDLFGLPADYDRINAIAAEHGLFVIEDAAQSFGAVYRGKRSCSLGNISCTSFFPAKPLGGYGDGGMCFTNDSGLDEIMRSLRVHGQGRDKYDNVRIGINGRLDTLQAAILLAKFDIFDEEIALRQEVAGLYNRYFEATGVLTAPYVPSDCQSAWAQYSLLSKDSQSRTMYQEKLKKEGVPTAIYYPKPLHLQEAFAHLGYKQGAFPVTEDCASRIFSLPMHPYLTTKDQERICKACIS
ncbi:UDP-2-acetamido-2-deoxy-3-oxo-D-glucuronate aminotransferase [uncultured Desulfobacterium sp.]|uniref:UDP-2-acetamido-2-deoxy-3-oxo-D-glucuronate aminotransferase n=1 Tax=uncultured Desulfobacterium sp. TaxID=201089 RepID=A0A445MVK8_9BACT|nr:UDP-2-acetamido-2-deoxy-3-oxo-D-glucuronate aminotransferase [uncultured Desulfobacterium sp.]